jgi:hypothetical protein
MKLAITNLSIPLHCVNFHRNLKEAGYDATLLQGDISKVDWRQYDVLWNIGSFLSMNVDILYEIVKKRNPNIKIVSHWVGTDLLQLNQFVTYRKKCLRCVLQDIDENVTDNRNFQKEFYDLTGLDAEYIPLIPEKPYDLKPLPEKFAVACYAYHPRLEFYRFATIIDTATKFPDMDFYFFRLEGESPVKNVHYLGWVEDKRKMELLEKCSVALSIPQHGSLSVLCIEMLQMGRRAITSEPHPHCLQAENPQDIIRFLTELKDKVSPDEETSKFYQEEYSLKHQLELVDGVLKKLG